MDPLTSLLGGAVSGGGDGGGPFSSSSSGSNSSSESTSESGASSQNTIDVALIDFSDISGTTLVALFGGIVVIIFLIVKNK